MTKTISSLPHGYFFVRDRSVYFASDFTVDDLPRNFLITNVQTRTQAAKLAQLLNEQIKAVTKASQAALQAAKDQETIDLVTAIANRSSRNPKIKSLTVKEKTAKALEAGTKLDANLRQFRQEGNNWR